jgi:hypothetical protein
MHGKLIAVAIISGLVLLAGCDQNQGRGGRSSQGCTFCDGTGYVGVCSKCNGDGAFFSQGSGSMYCGQCQKTTSNVYRIEACTACGGSGSGVVCGDCRSMASVRFVTKGTGKNKCTHCGGTGRT